MRLATWNCARGPWPAKRALVDSFGADLTVVTEAPKAVQDHGLTWFGNQLGLNGTTVVAGPGYSLTPLPQGDVPPCVNALRVTGPQEFTLLTVWTWPAKGHKNYKTPLLAGLEAYRSIQGPVVIAGDFNGNACFDKPRTRLKWSTCFEAVEQFGVVSAYHAFFNEPYGRESHPTQYQLRRKDSPFHLDYVFVPTAWRSAIRNVQVPAFSQYTESDHRPVIVDLDLT